MLFKEYHIGLSNPPATPKQAPTLFNSSSANSTSKVRINGVDANNSGLTAGQLYYVKNDGTLSTTAESGKVEEAGKAVSATKLVVKG